VIFSFSCLVNAREDIDRFTFLIFPVVFFIVFTQVYYILTGGTDFVNLLSPDYRAAVFTETGELRPVTGGVILIFFSYVFALFQMCRKHGTSSKIYLMVIVILCFLSVFLSATRVWFVMFSIIIVGYILFSRMQVKKVIQMISVTLLVVFVVLNFLPLGKGIVGSWQRVAQIGDVARGRFHEAQTFEHRVYKRLPRLMVGLRQNWIFGWGFSDGFILYSDAHVGNFNLLLQAGVLGFALFVYFWVAYCILVSGTRKLLSRQNSYRYSLPVFVYALVAMLVGHFTTYTFFGYTVAVNHIFFFSVFVSISESSVKEALRIEQHREVTDSTYKVILSS
jgi:hypothetical protein